MIKKKRKRGFKSRGNFYVYILSCIDGTFYTGHTNNLARRLKQHQSGKGGAWYTKMKGFGELAWKKRFYDFKTAFLTEMAIKKLTRTDKEKLVMGKSLKKLLDKKKHKPAL